jgi:hypothetical protein
MLHFVAITRVHSVALTIVSDKLDSNLLLVFFKRKMIAS